MSEIAARPRAMELGTIAASLPLPSRFKPAAAPRLPAWNWVTASVVGHVLIAVLLTWQFATRGKPQAPDRIQAILIISDSPSRAASTPQPPAPQPAPTPAPVKPADVTPKPSPKPKPEPQASKPEARPDTPKTATPPAERIGNEGESSFSLILDGVRGNWLQPAGPHIPFLCRLKIDYQPGGIISNVSIVKSCGNPRIDDSVLRAVWKTQPLPLDGDAAGKGGSLVLEFTP